jgi:hypothetical protein
MSKVKNVGKAGDNKILLNIKSVVAHGVHVPRDLVQDGRFSPNADSAVKDSAKSSHKCPRMIYNKRILKSGIERAYYIRKDILYDIERDPRQSLDWHVLGINPRGYTMAKSPERINFNAGLKS